MIKITFFCMADIPKWLKIHGFKNAVGDPSIWIITFGLHLEQDIPDILRYLAAKGHARLRKFLKGFLRVENFLHFANSCPSSILGVCVVNLRIPRKLHILSTEESRIRPFPINTQRKVYKIFYFKNV